MRRAASASTVNLPAASGVVADPAAATLFGESASCVVVSVRPDDRAALLQMAAEAGVPAQLIGRTGGNAYGYPSRARRD